MRVDHCYYLAIVLILCVCNSFQTKDQTNSTVYGVQESGQIATFTNGEWIQAGAFGVQGWMSCFSYDYNNHVAYMGAWYQSEWYLLGFGFPSLTVETSYKSPFYYNVMGSLFVAADTNTGNVYWTGYLDWKNWHILKYTLSSKTYSWVGNFSTYYVDQANGYTFDPSNNLLWITDLYNGILGISIQNGSIVRTMGINLDFYTFAYDSQKSQMVGFGHNQVNGQNTSNPLLLAHPSDSSLIKIIKSYPLSTVMLTNWFSVGLDVQTRMIYRVAADTASNQTWFEQYNFDTGKKYESVSTDEFYPSFVFADY